MKKLFIVLFVSVLIFSNCSKNENIKPEEQAILGSNIENPLEELDWLKDIKDSLSNRSCQSSIFQGKYQEKQVFYVMNTDPRGNSVFMVTLWDCNGNVVKKYGLGDNDLFASEVKEIVCLCVCSEYE
jgi:hypothetical protein